MRVELPDRWWIGDILEFPEGFVSLSTIIKLSLVGLFARMGILQLKNLEKKSHEEWMVSMERVRNIGEV